VRGYYAGGPKTTLSGFRVEIVGTNGYILISDRGATLHQNDVVETIEAPSWDMTGIPAGVRELVGIVAEGGEPVSPGSEGYKVVQIIIGFLTSQQRDNGKVKLPLSGS
jgi:predicted dehydrogenase